MTSLGPVAASYRKRYPHSSRSVGAARREVVAFARACGFSAQELADIEAAVGEGLANSVEHAHRSDDGIEVTATRNGGTLVIEIKDSGGGFDHGRVCAKARPPTEAPRGFGTFIMRELMDEVSYSEVGTRLRLVKRLAAAARQRSRAQG